MKNGLILWVLGGTGVLFIYAAFINVKPQDILLKHLGQDVTQEPIATAPSTTQPSGSGMTVPDPLTGKVPTQGKPGVPDPLTGATTSYPTYTKTGQIVNA